MSVRTPSETREQRTLRLIADEAQYFNDRNVYEGNNHIWVAIRNDSSIHRDDQRSWYFKVKAELRRRTDECKRIKAEAVIKAKLRKAQEAAKRAEEDRLLDEVFPERKMPLVNGRYSARDMRDAWAHQMRQPRDAYMVVDDDDLAAK